MSIYMVLSMPATAHRNAQPSPSGRVAKAACSCALLAFGALLAVVQGKAQSSGATAQLAVPAPALESTPSGPQPDRARARNAFLEGRHAEQAGDWDAEFAAYTQAARYDPSNREYSMLKEHARFQVVQALVENAERQAIAGDTPGARALLNRALEIDPKYDVARERLSELAPESTVAASPDDGAQTQKGPRLSGLPRLTLKPGTRAFDYRGTMRGAYGELANQYGFKVVFDADLSDRPVEFQIPAVDFDTAVMILSRQTKTFTRVVDAHTLFVTDDNAQKQREYAIEINKELPLPASVGSDEMNEVVRMVREMTGITRTQLNTASRTLTVRSTEQNVALAEAILKQIEQPHGEMMLEIEILEIDRSTANQLGVTPPTSSSLFMLTLPQIQQLEAANNSGTLAQALQSIFGSAISSASGAALPPLIAFGGGKTIFLATVSDMSVSFGSALSTVQSAQRVLLRAQDGKPATFFVGDRYPISLGLLSSDLNPTPTGLSAAVAAALTSGLSLPTNTYDVGQAPISVAIADFNEDGKPDLAVANQKDGTISILLGNGDGTFTAPATPCALPSCIQLPPTRAGRFSTPASPSAITTGTVVLNGHISIAVTDQPNNQVFVLIGNGDGTFQTPVAYGTGTAPVAVVAQDFDGDGSPDLAVVNQGDGTTPGTVSILLGNKPGGAQDGTFPTQIAYPVGVSPSAIATGTFETDGFTSVAVTNKGDNTVSILLGQADNTTGVPNGTFAPQVTYSTGTSPAGVSPAGIAVGDFNNDGKSDLAVTYATDTSNNSVSILLGNGDGTFGTAKNFPAGSGPVGIVAGAFAGTNVDLAVADESGNNIDVLIGNGDGTFMTPISLPTGNAPVALATADVNGDGTLDLVSANNSSNTVTVTLNTVASSLGNNSSTSPQSAYPSAEYEDLGLKVKATPHLHAGDEVTLQLQFDIKSLTGQSINGIPILSNRSIEQTIRLRENETSVLSGILQSSDLRTKSGLPWVSTVPGIGLLTGEDTENIQKTELLIVITPRAFRLPAREGPAIYAGRGEPNTPPSGPPPLPAAPPPGPAGAPAPGQVREGERGQFGAPPNPAPGQPVQPLQAPVPPQQPPQQQPPEEQQQTPPQQR
jgi:Flp pilus assembly secretin CpaC